MRRTANTTDMCAPAGKKTPITALCAACAMKMNCATVFMKRNGFVRRPCAAYATMKRCGNRSTRAAAARTIARLMRPRRRAVILCMHPGGTTGLTERPPWGVTEERPCAGERGGSPADSGRRTARAVPAPMAPMPSSVPPAAEEPQQELQPPAFEASRPRYRATNGRPLPGRNVTPQGDRPAVLEEQYDAVQHAARGGAPGNAPYDIPEAPAQPWCRRWRSRRCRRRSRRNPAHRSRLENRMHRVPCRLPRLTPIRPIPRPISNRTRRRPAF